MRYILILLVTLCSTSAFAMGAFPTVQPQNTDQQVNSAQLAASRAGLPGISQAIDANWIAAFNDTPTPPAIQKPAWPF
jgi:hypothetical protein